VITNITFTLSRSNKRTMDQLANSEEDFNIANFLPIPDPPEDDYTIENNQPLPREGPNLVETTREKLLQKLIPDTTMFYRANNHKMKLQSMKKLPTSLQIKAVAQGVHTETPQFKTKWQQAIQKSEELLYNTLLNHLKDTASHYQQKMQEYCKTARNNLMNEMTRENADIIIKEITDQHNQTPKRSRTREK